MQFAKNCSKGFLSEFQLKKFGFEHNQCDQFYRSQWQTGERSALFLIYRWLWALFFIVVFIASLALQFSDGKFFIYLTNWGILLCLLTQLIAAILVTRWHYDLGAVRAIALPSDDAMSSAKGERTPILLKFYWLLYGVSLSLAVVITTVYWTFLHGRLDKPVRFPGMSFITHCLNSVFMLVDFLIIAFPFRLLHVIYVMLLTIGYCLFTVIYFFCGGVDEYGNEYVYPILNWKNPTRGMSTFGGVFVLFVIYALILFCIYRCKRAYHRLLNIGRMPQTVGLI